jgi:hypothetical protein
VVADVRHQLSSSVMQPCAFCIIRCHLVYLCFHVAGVCELELGHFANRDFTFMGTQQSADCAACAGCLQFK